MRSQVACRRGPNLTLPVGLDPDLWATYRRWSVPHGEGATWRGLCASAMLCSAFKTRRRNDASAQDSTFDP